MRTRWHEWTISNAGNTKACPLLIPSPPPPKVLVPGGDFFGTPWNQHFTAKRWFQGVTKSLPPMGLGVGSHLEYHFCHPLDTTLHREALVPGGDFFCTPWNQHFWGRWRGAKQWTSLRVTRVRNSPFVSLCRRLFVLSNFLFSVDCKKLGKWKLLIL